MGLDSIGCSDSASDMAFSVIDAMADKLIEESKDKGNKYNTDGSLNVALFFKDIITPMDEYHFKSNEKLQKLARTILPKVKAQRNSFGRDLSSEVDALVSSLEKFLEPI